MICKNCNTDKPQKDFHKDKRQKSGYINICEECFQKHSESLKNGTREYIIHEEKICSICKQEQLIINFGRRRNSPDGYDTVCKECRKKKAAYYREAHRERIRENNRRYAKNHAQEIKERYRSKIDADPSFLNQQKEQRHAYYLKNITKIKESQHKYYIEHSEEIKQRSREWDRKHSDELRILRKERRQNNPEIAIRETDRTRLKRTGWTREEYEKNLISQGWKCYICKTFREDAPKKVLVADHNHETKEKRHLLCSLCNFGIAKFLDNPSIIRNAIHYLQYWEEKHKNLLKDNSEEHWKSVLYEDVLKEQKGKCAICGIKEQDTVDGIFHKDHSHNTGLRRGLLCRECNHGIGHFHDSIEHLTSAIYYLLEDYSK